MSTISKTKQPSCGYCDGDEIENDYMLKCGHFVCKLCLRKFMTLQNQEFCIRCRCGATTFINIKMQLIDNILNDESIANPNPNLYTSAITRKNENLTSSLFIDTNFQKINRINPQENTHATTRFYPDTRLSYTNPSDQQPVSNLISSFENKNYLAKNRINPQENPHATTRFYPDTRLSYANRIQQQPVANVTSSSLFENENYLVKNRINPPSNSHLTTPFTDTHLSYTNPSDQQPVSNLISSFENKNYLAKNRINPQENPHATTRFYPATRLSYANRIQQQPVANVTSSSSFENENYLVKNRINPPSNSHLTTPFTDTHLSYTNRIQQQPIANLTSSSSFASINFPRTNQIDPQANTSIMRGNAPSNAQKIGFVSLCKLDDSCNCGCEGSIYRTTPICRIGSTIGQPYHPACAVKKELVNKMVCDKTVTTSKLRTIERSIKKISQKLPQFERLNYSFDDDDD